MWSGGRILPAAAWSGGECCQEPKYWTVTPASHYSTNSPVLRHSPQSISIWKALTVRDQRGNIRQFLDITVTAERIWYRALEYTFAYVRAWIFQHTELCTVWPVAVVLYTYFCHSTKRTDWMYGYLIWFSRFCWKRTTEMQLRKIVFMFRIKIQCGMLERTQLVLEPRSL